MVIGFRRNVDWTLIRAGVLGIYRKVDDANFFFHMASTIINKFAPIKLYALSV